MNVDARSLAKRNLCSNGSGQLQVRPGLRRLKTFSNKWIAGGFTIKDSRASETTHYVVLTNDAPPFGVSLVILDENLVEQATITINSNTRPRFVSSGQVLQQLMIGIDGAPSMWGVIGSTCRIATKVDSVDPTLTALEVPDGLLLSWVNRVVIFQGTSMFVSDPVAVTGGSPRTFTADNQSITRGNTFGAHVGAGGMLVVCTDKGVFGLDSSAAAIGTVIPDWRLLSHHQTFNFQTTCAVDGRIYGLTKRGYKLIDTENAPEITLDDPMMTRALGTRISIDDYRSCRMYPGEDGPIIFSPTAGALYVDEGDTGVSSWWTTTTNASDIVFDVVGVLKDVDGADLLLTKSGIFAMDGNFDGLQALSSAFASQPTGFMHGTLPTSPADNHTVRHVHVAAAQGTVSAAVRGDLQSSTAYVDSVNGPVIGTSSWGGSWRHMTAPVVAHRLDFNVNANDLAIEAGVAGCNNRLGSVIALGENEQGRKRPQDRG